MAHDVQYLQEQLDLSVLSAPARQFLREAIDRLPTQGPSATAPVANEVWLNSIEVEGFRGIGDRLRLELEPGPGLTVVVGRNGSGKSSLAEAVEMAFTGTLSWLKSLTGAWKGGLPNVHTSAHSVSLKMRSQSLPEIHLRRRILSGVKNFSEPEEITVGDQRSTFQGLRWSEAIESHPPWLSHPQLRQTLIDGDSRGHDAIAAILGLSWMDPLFGAVRGDQRSRAPQRPGSRAQDPCRSIG